MIRLPEILIVDDVLGQEPALAYRAEFCAALGLYDPATSPTAEGLAKVTFFSGQRRRQDWVENDPEETLKRIKAGWPFPDGHRWAMVCLDQMFDEGGGGYFEPTAFGRQLADRIRDDPALRDLPLVMLAGERPDNVEKKVRDAMDAHQPGGAIRFFQKWSRIASSPGAANPAYAFGELLFAHGLVEDGQLRLARSTGAISSPLRQGPLIEGSSPALLRALRDIRIKTLAREPVNLLIESEPGDEVLPVLAYARDHRDAAREYFLGMGKARATTELPPRGGHWDSLHVAGLHRLSSDDLQALQKLLEAQALAEGKATKMVVASTVQGPSASSPPSQHAHLATYFRTIAWPPLRERNDDAVRMFQTLLKTHGGAGARSPGGQLELSAVTAISRHDWPGNARELRAVASEIVGDLNFQTRVSAADVRLAIESAGAPRHAPGVVSLDVLIQQMSTFRCRDERELENAWPRLQQGLGALLETLFDQGREATARSSGDFNISQIGRLLGATAPDTAPKDLSNATVRFARNMRKYLGWKGPTVDRILKEDTVEAGPDARRARRDGR
jgi:hypothetical protein